jgi:hypothetical protein
MVKKRLVLLVLAFVAISLVSCKKVHKPKTTQAPQTCAQLLSAESKDCLTNVPAGYDPHTCKFNIKNENCDWECHCEEIVTEAPTVKPKKQYDAKKSNGNGKAGGAKAAARRAAKNKKKAADPLGDESSESFEECETDKKIEFKNSCVKVSGFVKKSK